MAIKKISQLNPLPLSCWWYGTALKIADKPETYQQCVLSNLNLPYIDRSLIELSQFDDERNDPATNSYYLSYQTNLGDLKAMLGLSAVWQRLSELSSIFTDGLTTIISGSFWVGQPIDDWQCPKIFNPGPDKTRHTVFDDNRKDENGNDIHFVVYVPYEFTNQNGGTFHGPIKMHSGLTCDNSVHFTGSLTCDNPIHGVALSACWADIAETYEADDDYSPGTLVKFGGEKEITVASHHANAVVTSQPGVMLNKESKGTGITLTGRVPVKVIGPVQKFDKIVLSATPGVGIACNSPEKTPGFLISNTVVGRALESSNDVGIKLVECVVQMNLE
jgi:hypothetical protein